ncbi:MAG: M15 family metallopeptidase [Actinomycetota bacterium]|nr:M15 family metallopeptidase [Actinomycetota bacterium]
MITFDSGFGTSTGAPIRVTCHSALRPRLQLALKRARNFSAFGRKDRVNRIDSFNCRVIAGTSTLSNHGRGAAWDIFATDPGVPPPGGVFQPDDTFGRDFAACFTDLGFRWGGEFDRPDDPHMEWPGEFVPPLTMRERARTRRLAKERVGQ